MYDTIMGRDRDGMEQNPKAPGLTVEVRFKWWAVWPAGKLPNEGYLSFCGRQDMRKKRKASDGGTSKWKKGSQWYAMESKFL